MTADWQLVQVLGDKPISELVDGDVVSAVEFDQSGVYLATGDRGGRVRIYEKVQGNQNQDSSGSSTAANKGQEDANEYRLWHEFQSHDAEFDYLKSLEIEEKINCLRWCKPLTSAFLLLTTNDKTIKLWRAQDKSKTSVISSYVDKKAPAPPQTSARRLFPSSPKASGVCASPRKVFANGHAYHINSISLNSDCETFISADDLRINLWNLGVTDTCFNIVDIKPSNMEELTEVITAAACHPTQCNVFLWSNSRGSIKLADTRDRALCDAHAKVFEEEDDPARRSFFSEIISSIADVKFSLDGRYMVSRDYMCLKLWDVNMESKPLRTIFVHEQLRGKLCDLYENDAIFDKFQCAMSGDAQLMMTGSYHNHVHIYDASGKETACLEATGNKRRPAPKPRLNLPRPKIKKEEVVDMDLDKKVLHCAWHPTEPSIAVGALNAVYVYSAAP